MKILALGLIIITLCAATAAQANVERPCTPKKEILADGSIRITGCDGKSLVLEPAVPATPPQTVEVGAAPTKTDSKRKKDEGAGATLTVSSKLAEAYERYQIASLRHEEEQLERNSRVFAWQDVSSKVMFWVVLLIVLTGLVLAALQFRKADQIDISAGKDGVHLRTTLVGVAILAMSMVFLYLYLFFVYPIKAIQ